MTLWHFSQSEIRRVSHLYICLFGFIDNDRVVTVCGRLCVVDSLGIFVRRSGSPARGVGQREVAVSVHVVCGLWRKARR
jgi:hypothetical protein